MARITKDSIQFGEGNFLRAFVDYCIQILNTDTPFDGKVSIVQPLPNGTLSELMRQKGKYHLFQEGILDGKTQRNSIQIDCIDQMINPYESFESYLKLAENENLTFVFSNTTEAGIAHDENDDFNASPPQSFPGKLLRFLYHRYEKFNGDKDKVLHIIPCELIDKNGSKLRDIMTAMCDQWQLEEDFKTWLKTNHFYNTLVDRIVPGFPTKDLDFYKKDLPFDDRLMVTSEPFFLWVIEGDQKLLELFPVDQLKDVNVTIVPDLGIYRTRKVRILNGGHTTIVPVGLLHGTPTVSGCLEDPFLKKFLSQTLYEEIIPSIDFDKEALEDYAQSVLERFSNPFIIHQLASISLNSISKFKVRVLPSLLNYNKKQNKIPKNITFAMAALLYFYGKEVSQHQVALKDDASIIAFFDQVWKDSSVGEVVDKTLSNTALWDQNLTEVPQLKETLTQALTAITSQKTIAEAYQAFNP